MVDVFKREAVVKGKISSNKKDAALKKKQSVVMVPEAKKMYKDFGGGRWLGSLSVWPKGVSFESQHDDEVVILLARRHIITNLWWLALSCLLLFVPFFWGSFPIIPQFNFQVQFGLWVVWYLGLFFFVLERLLLWYYNIYIITDERVIDVDFFGLLYKNLNITQIRKIEDVNYSQIGMFSSLFNYGDVVIQTSSEQMSIEVDKEGSSFTFKSIPNPDRIAIVLGELIEQEELEEYEGRVR
jgi:membrane protein YdbS with pleckstrin-like domain